MKPRRHFVATTALLIGAVPLGGSIAGVDSPDLQKSGEFSALQSIAEDFYQAYSRFDFEAVRLLCHPDCIHWTNYTEQEILYVRAFMGGRDIVTNALDGFDRKVSRRLFDAGGWAQAHTTLFRFKDQTTLKVPGSHFVSVADGRVWRIDEYADKTQMDVVNEKVSSLVS